MKIGVVDYKAGNLRSMETTLKELGADFIISGDTKELEKCGKLIFPGVGEASSAMKYLNKTGLADFIKSWTEKELPLFGICLGCQIILSFSEEGNANCLGLVEGKVKLFNVSKSEITGEKLKVPHIGWNSLRFVKNHFLFKDIPDNSSFYFVHSYYPFVSEEFAIGKTDYSVTFTSAVAKNNICAVQFHPEKSGKFGLKMVENFISFDGELSKCF